MFNFLHAFHPSPILASIGPINIYWYGFFIMLAVLAALTVAIYLAKLHSIKKEAIIDLAFWLIVGGLIGARIYDVFLELPYFLANPLNIFKIWQGGLAIHGAIIGGLIALWLYAKKYQHNFWQLAAIIATSLPLAQAIGRWGNYFNQELFGYPTNLAWGIPIDLAHRPWQYLNYEYFHPTFLYESLGNLIIFIILFTLHIKKVTTRLPDGQGYELRVTSYLLLYSLLRFATEFIRLDATPAFLGPRLPQLVSLIIFFLCLIYLALKFGQKVNEKSGLEK